MTEKKSQEKKERITIVCIFLKLPPPGLPALLVATTIGELSVCTFWSLPKQNYLEKKLSRVTLDLQVEYPFSSSDASLAARVEQSDCALNMCAMND